MPYVSRDANNNINGVYANRQDFTSEFLADNDPTLIAYLSPPVPDISRRQFYQQLAVQGIITQAEALAAVTSGSIPAALQVLINGLPSSEQFPATMLIVGNDTYHRSHPLVAQIGIAYGWTSAQMDAFFNAAAAL